MNEILLLFAMIFFHIWDDYGRQGILASMKQKSWWKRQEGYTDNYAHDWIPALLSHAFSWTCMVFVPVILYEYLVGTMVDLPLLLVLFGWNMIIHFVVDNAKCNAFEINLCEDQFIHLMQIGFLWLCVIM